MDLFLVTASPAVWLMVGNWLDWLSSAGPWPLRDCGDGTWLGFLRAFKDSRGCAFTGLLMTSRWPLVERIRICDLLIYDFDVSIVSFVAKLRLYYAWSTTIEG